jgi:hypothetical protein
LDFGYTLAGTGAQKQLARQAGGGTGTSPERVPHRGPQSAQVAAKQNTASQQPAEQIIARWRESRSTAKNCGDAELDLGTQEVGRMCWQVAAGEFRLEQLLRFE